jgi:hypothetical protein
MNWVSQILQEITLLLGIIFYQKIICFAITQEMCVLVVNLSHQNKSSKEMVGLRNK